MENASRFVHALQQLEETRNIDDSMLGLFDEGCEVSNVAVRPLSGRQGARRFWHDYLSTFSEVHTRFTRQFETDGKCYLEWISEGVLPNGHPIKYEGITVLEWDGDHIRRFKAYHDSAAFLRNLVRAA
jgi:hypothetical protein